MDILELNKKEGFELKGNKIIAFGKEFPLVHPFAIYGKLYREEQNPEMKYLFMKKLHDILWPYDWVTWNFWTERRFKTYCSGYRIMSWAGGASIGKSVDAAKIGLIEWLSAPHKNGIIVASTTLESLKGRVYGYLISYLKGAKVNLEYNISRSMPPKILFDRDDTVHSISTIAAARGGDQAAIKNYIGRHPKEKLLLVLDEGPDLDESILGAIPNLDNIPGKFQCIVIGNSSSKSDLHGALSTPKDGWETINIDKGDNVWETTQEKGICLFFDAYESPAIFEKNAEKAAALKKFLPTRDIIDDKKRLYGEESDAFWRFVRGYWRTTSADDTVISKLFLEEFQVGNKTEWSGVYPVTMVAGLDPAFSVGGDDCILRFGRLGVDINGLMVLDYCGEELMYKVPILANGSESVEIQIANYVLRMLKFHNCRLANLCIDSNGAGRALSEVIRLRGGMLEGPIRLMTIGHGIAKTKNKNVFDMTIVSAYDMWFRFRDFIQNRQIRGLDDTSKYQLSNRKTLVKDDKGNLLKVPKLENKQEFKRRLGAVMPSLGHSPDQADAAALCLQAAIINFGFYPGQRREVHFDYGGDEKFFVYKAELKAEEQQHRPSAPAPNFEGGMEEIAKYTPKVFRNS